MLFNELLLEKNTEKGFKLCKWQLIKERYVYTYRLYIICILSNDSL